MIGYFGQAATSICKDEQINLYVSEATEDLNISCGLFAGSSQVVCRSYLDWVMLNRW